MEGQKIQWLKEKGQQINNLQSTTQKPNDWVSRTPLKPMVNSDDSDRVSNSCFNSGTHCVTLLKSLQYKWRGVTSKR